MIANKKIFLLITTVWTALILYYSIIPAPEVPGAGPTVSGTILHLAAYFVYGLLLRKTVGCFSSSKTKTIVFSVLIGIALGAFTEAIQLFIPNRFADIFDFAADAVGVFVGAKTTTMI